jgi:DNA modification methylase
MMPAFTTGHVTVYCGDALAVLRELPSDSVDCVVTSPPYWGLRDYGVDGQVGLERTPPRVRGRHG